MRIVNPAKPHNFEPSAGFQILGKFTRLVPGCKHCGASKRNPRIHPNEDDYR